MTSILTNSAATSAIETLRTINRQLGAAESDLSTGLRIAGAADNAAYWSISSTIRSDEMAMSAVQDAIGLGAAKVDTAYAAMSSTVEVLTKFQAKLVAAKEESADRNKIQSELDQLKDQVVSVANSASFSGVNWLNTSFENIFDVAQSTDKLISSFVRSNNGSIAVKTTDVDLSRLSLFNSTGGGLLQADYRSPGTVGGIRNTMYSFDPSGQSAWENYIFDGPLTFPDNSTAISFTLNLDADDPSNTTGAQTGTTQTYTIDRSAIDTVNSGWNGVVSTRAQWRQVLQSVIGGSVRIFQDVSNPAKYSIETTETSGRGASYQMSVVTSTLGGGKTGGLQDSPAIIYGTRAYSYSIWDDAFELKPTVEAYVSVIENHGSKTLTLTQDTVMAALGTTNGKVTSIGDYIQVLNYAFSDQGFGIEAKNLGSGLIRYDLIETVNPEAGRKTSLGIVGVTDNVGDVPEFGLLDIDITGSYSIDRYIDGIQSMLSKTVDGAAILGALTTRLAMQESYNQSVIDSVNRGIGRLVDTDMNEASTRLKALQTQQQLTIQSLSIANAVSENIIQLFR
ncbi:flagellin N-terminal helical domain-containing protein [Agrobacterium sp. Azo12]|uniref:flagellin N-terminal helical domain-containing protein n=1 Tax=Agrobacterium sp. Azo12 TaxID=3031129 RepID=UPI0023D85840|nr:flagellin [Agrobacterium sp. Azo12]MDO5897885.1 flagellin [Agrobacterium sp. Azo12]